MTEDELISGLPTFLLPKNKKDKDGRRTDNPDYDSSTLYIPATDLAGFTPTM